MFKDILQLVSGTLIAQVIILLAMPILTRVYTPAQFGVYAISIGFLSIASPFSTLRYETAILIKEKNYNIFSLVLLSFCIILFSSAVMLFFLSVFPVSIVTKEEYTHLKYIFLLIFMCAGAVEVLTVWHLRNKRYSTITIGKVIQALAVVGFQIGLYKILGGLGLIYGYMIGLLLSAFYYVVMLLLYDWHGLKILESMQTIRRSAIVNKNFPLYSVWSSLLNTLGNQLPILLFGRLSGVEVSGLYDVTRRYTRAPLSLVGQSIFRVVSQRIGILEDSPKEAAKILSTVFYKMLSYSIVPFIVVVASFQYLFSFMFGEQWYESGIYAQIIAPWMFSIFISWPLTSAYNTFGYQRQLIIFNILFILSIVIPFAFMYTMELTVIETLVVLSFFGSISRILYCYWILSKCQVKYSKKHITLLATFMLLIAGVSSLSIWMMGV